MKIAQLLMITTGAGGKGAPERVILNPQPPKPNKYLAN
jgi:hypothetical protein